MGVYGPDDGTSSRTDDEACSTSLLDAEFRADLSNGSHSLPNGIHGDDPHKSLPHVEVIDPSITNIGGDRQIRSGCIGMFVPTAFLPELKQTLIISWPMVIMQLSSFLMQPLVSVFVGHLGKQELAAIALANSMINVLGLAVVYGLASMCDSYFSQTHGANNNKLNGLFLQRAICIHLLALLPLIAIHINMESILVFIGEDPAISRLSGQYLTYFIPGFFFMFLHVVFRKFTYCQNVIYPNLLVSVTSLPLHAALQYLLVYTAELGIVGSAVGEALIYLYMLAATVAYIYCSGMLKDCWTGWSWSCLEDWGPMVSLGLFGMFMIVLELFAFEVVTILSGLLGDTQLGAQTIMFNVDLMLYGIPSGIAIAASVRVGWHLGANEPLSAKTAASCGIFITMIISSIFCVVLFSFKSDVPKMFSNDSDVVALAASLMPYICIYMFADHISATCRALYRVTGKTAIGATVIFITYYIFALPVGIPLMFCTDLQLSGLWITLTLVLICNAAVYLIIIYAKFDWSVLAMEATKRVRTKESQTLEEENAEEKQPLLPSTKELSAPQPEQPISREVIIRRTIEIAVMFGILLAGVIIRLTVKTSNSKDSVHWNNDNSTQVNHTLTVPFTGQYNNATSIWDEPFDLRRPLLYPK